MPILEWDFFFLLGIPEIDQHHKHLVALLNRTYDQYKEGAPNLAYTIEELFAYADYHFSCEERWMKETSYPDFSSHKEEHDAFTSRVQAFHASLNSESGLSVEIMSFLSNWITHHILQTDVRFGQFVDEQKLAKRMHTILVRASQAC